MRRSEPAPAAVFYGHYCVYFSVNAAHFEQLTDGQRVGLDPEPLELRDIVLFTICARLIPVSLLKKTAAHYR